MAKYWRNNIVIWSHCLHCLLHQVHFLAKELCKRHKVEVSVKCGSNILGNLISVKWLFLAINFLSISRHLWSSSQSTIWSDLSSLLCKGYYAIFMKCPVHLVIHCIFIKRINLLLFSTVLNVTKELDKNESRPHS